MSDEIQYLLIALVFASQIVVISFVVPLRYRRFYAEFFERYSDVDYPHLYPLPRAELERQLDRY